MEELEKAFNANNAFFTHNAKREPYVILINGKCVTLEIEKNVWSCIGTAKKFYKEPLSQPISEVLKLST